MPDIFRFHTIRGVEELPKSELDKLSLATHSDTQQSEWYKMLESLCKQKDFRGIISAILTFLKSENAIHTLEQLDKDFKPVFKYIESKGGIKTEKDKEELFKLVDLRKFPDYFKEKEIKIDDACGNTTAIKISKFNLELQNVADTQLSLSILGKLGHKENINYNLLFKVFHLLKLLFDKKKEVSLAEITQLFDKTTTLPACFFKLNPCSKKLEPVQIENPFSHLGILDFDKNDNKPQILNIRGKDLTLHTAEHSGEIGEIGDMRQVKFPNGNKENECNCDCDESCKGQNPCCATIKPFVTDLMVVREELHCYKAKHLAYVETIMLGEERVREHRHLERTEDYSEKETTISKSEEKDHQVSERFSLQTESEKTIESDLSIDAGVTANMWGTGYKVETSLDVASNNSKSESQRVAREQAVDITERTVRKIQETVRELTTKKKIVETEETNSHTFKNSTADGGTKHINGMYQFINAEYKGQVMNYGKRLMFEFILPEPMQLYKKLMSKQIDPFGIEKPKKPNVLPTDISDDPTINTYFIKLLNDQDASFDNINLPPETQISISNQFKYENNNKESEASSATPPNSYEIEEGFRAIRAEVTGGITWAGFSKDEWGQNADQRLTVSVGQQYFNFGNSDNPDSFHSHKNLNGETKSVPVAINSRGAISYGITVEIICQRTDLAYKKWQLEVYNILMLAYEEKLNKYEADLARYNAAKEQKTKFGRNPFLNREIERTELKRMAISYISCQFYDQFTAMKRNVKPCGYPQMDLEQAQKDGSFIQFFEQLFDWNLMTYLFYPYFWGQKCSWANKIQEDSGDPLFDKALMAGAARVQVPVKSGHEPLAMHWITFGEIWQGTGQPPVPGSPYYISMAQEIKEQKGVFNADREGVLEVTDGSDIVKLTDSSFYWDFGSIAVDQFKIDKDIDREIFIDCVTYRIVSITRTNSTDTDKWDIQLERNYETTFGTNPARNIKWSTGALYVGAEFLITVPTNLVYLKNKKVNGEYVTEDCLPCFPQEKCE